MNIRKLAYSTVPCKPARMVLLAVHGEQFDQRLLASAVALCGRLNAGLEILASVTDDSLIRALRQFMTVAGKNNCYWTLIPAAALRRRDIVDYANTHENIAAVVIDSLDLWHGRAQDRHSNPWLKLGCPLVTAIPGQPAAPRPQLN